VIIVSNVPCFYSKDYFYDYKFMTVSFLKKLIVRHNNFFGISIKSWEDHDVKIKKHF